MISVTDALAFIAAQQKDFGEEQVPLLQSAGRILAQPVLADRDFPPFHRATMDGFAIASSAFAEGLSIFMIEGVQPAGRSQVALSNAAHCIEIMTGAVVPQGADAVIPYEDCTITDGAARVNVPQVLPFQNIHLKGSDERQGEVLIPPHQRITPAMIGIMATVGITMVPVRKTPRVAICGTGDELVPIKQQPAAHQIRSSNLYMLAAALQAESIIATGHYLPDDPQAMAAELSKIIKGCDVIIFSGAVSKGKYDFLPQVLGSLGMQTIFHRVAQKPGKPLLFGRFNGGPLVFGLPGNPVSTLVCYHVFFRYWLYGSLRLQQEKISALLAAPVTFKPALAFLLPVTLNIVNGITEATPCFGTNSGDSVSLAKAEGILFLPAEQEQFDAGAVYDLLLL